MVIIVGFGFAKPVPTNPEFHQPTGRSLGCRSGARNELNAGSWLLESLHLGLACWMDHTAGRDLFHPACPDQSAAHDFQPAANRSPGRSLHCTAPAAAESRSGVSLLQRTIRDHGAVGPGGRELVGTAAAQLAIAAVEDAADRDYAGITANPGRLMRRIGLMPVGSHCLSVNQPFLHLPIHPNNQ